ncbi:MAG: PQQ-binding-like beta-propeller repeat protein [Planctomycetes bacterium]|nr:PQQ-binding-like beta-propeller repeat protein [Planctomycetota bacterium]
MFGGTPARNMVNTSDKNVPIDFSVEEGKQKQVKWVAELGNKAYGGPVVAGGRVFVGTNNATPRDPKDKGKNKAVLMAFNEADGKFLWQAVHDTPPDDIFSQAAALGLFSTPVVEGERLYYVTPACEVICASVKDGKSIWRLDMMKELKVVPYHCANCSPLVVGDLVMLVTSNGMNDEGKISSPKAPSFLAVNKNTGKVAWQSNLPGDNIIDGQWSNPALAKVNGKDMVIFPGGDAWLYGFEAKSGELLWKCNCNPQPAKDGKNYFVATPVVAGTKLYIGLGQYPEHPEPTRHSYVLCLDLTGKGDVSPKSMEMKDPGNKGSALIWAFGGPILPRPAKGRPVNFGRTISTCAVHDGLVFVAEESGYLHCLDEKTGQKLWEHDLKCGIWGSPYVVDGKVLIGGEDGTIKIFATGRNEKVLAAVELDDTFQGTPVVANGVLYMVTKSKLFAIAERK